jgi:hypothetical protein
LHRDSWETSGVSDPWHMHGCMAAWQMVTRQAGLRVAWLMATWLLCLITHQALDRPPVQALRTAQQRAPPRQPPPQQGAGGAEREGWKWGLATCDHLLAC